MSRWAFSSSSSSTTDQGLRRTRSVSWPPSSWPTYPGGEPMRRETAWASIYSDMSKRSRASWLPNRAAARARHSWVLPTPLGPSRRKQPTGLRGSRSPSRLRRMARTTASTARSWPSRRRRSSWSRPARAFRSASSGSVTGTPVHWVSTARMWLSSTRLGPWRACHCLRPSSSWRRKSPSASRSMAAFSKSCSRMASPICRPAWAARSSRAFSSGGRLPPDSLAREAASSTRSMALSGRKRSVI